MPDKPALHVQAGSVLLGQTDVTLRCLSSAVVTCGDGDDYEYDEVSFDERAVDDDHGAGCPKHTYVWMKDGDIVKNEAGDSLVIETLTATEAGAYTCAVINPAGISSDPSDVIDLPTTSDSKGRSM